MPPRTRCDACGQLLPQLNAHSLLPPMVHALAELVVRGHGCCRISDLEWDRNMIDNFQKLKYFGFVVKLVRGGQNVRGWWQVTSIGQRFLSGRMPVRRRVYSYNDNFHHFDADSPLVTIEHYPGHWRRYLTRDDYAAQALPYDMA